jgi:transcriptional regulator with XRE-family HTH domain
MPRQTDLAHATGLHQSRISVFETPGAANVTLETLAKIAAGFKVGLIVKFVPFSEMLRWEDNYSQDTFDVLPRLEQDEEFLNPAPADNEPLSNEPRMVAAAGAGIGADNLESDQRKPPQSAQGDGPMLNHYDSEQHAQQLALGEYQ